MLQVFRQRCSSHACLAQCIHASAVLCSIRPCQNSCQLVTAGAHVTQSRQQALWHVLLLCCHMMPSPCVQACQHAALTELCCTQLLTILALHPRWSGCCLVSKGEKSHSPPGTQREAHNTLQGRHNMASNAGSQVVSKYAGSKASILCSIQQLQTGSSPTRHLVHAFITNMHPGQEGTRRTR